MRESPSHSLVRLPLTLRLHRAARIVDHAKVGTKTWLRPLLAGLEAGVCSDSDLVDFGLENGGSIAAASVIEMLRRLNARGALSFVLHDRGRFLAEARGDFAGAPYVQLEGAIVLSPHVFFRPSAVGTSVGSATRSDEIHLPSHVAKALLDSKLVGGGQTVAEAINHLHESLRVFTKESLHALVSLLIRADVFLRSEADLSGNGVGTRMWEFHDLLFHTRTTQGHGFPRPQGSTYRFAHAIPSEPALRRNEWPHHASLPHFSERDLSVPFCEVLKRRRSPPDGCTMADDIDLAQLGRFLSGLAVVDGPSASEGLYDVTRRLYPGAGACYELEVFPLIVRCNGIERGLYFYDPATHSLHWVSGWSRKLESLSASACRATGRISSPCVILLLSSRFERIAWKYEGIAYALSLKNVGVLFEFMYLLGAALELEVCALGSVEAGLFSELLGEDAFREPLVGQFMIVGRRFNP